MTTTSLHKKKNGKLFAEEITKKFCLNVKKKDFRIIIKHRTTMCDLNFFKSEGIMNISCLIGDDDYFPQVYMHFSSH